MNKLVQRITPFLWFDSQAGEAVKFYTSIFRIPESRLLLYGAQPQSAGEVNCQTQEEIDKFWTSCPKPARKPDRHDS